VVIYFALVRPKTVKLTVFGIVQVTFFVRNRLGAQNSLCKERAAFSPGAPNYWAKNAQRSKPGTPNSLGKERAAF
jgi:hypothetical protein